MEEKVERSVRSICFGLGIFILGAIGMMCCGLTQHLSNFRLIKTGWIMGLIVSVITFIIGLKLVDLEILLIERAVFAIFFGWTFFKRLKSQEGKI